jgi:hypothetical protein
VLANLALVLPGLALRLVYALNWAGQRSVADGRISRYAQSLQLTGGDYPGFNVIRAPFYGLSDAVCGVEHRIVAHQVAQSVWASPKHGWRHHRPLDRQRAADWPKYRSVQSFLIVFCGFVADKCLFITLWTEWPACKSAARPPGLAALGHLGGDRVWAGMSTRRRCNRFLVVVFWRKRLSARDGTVAVRAKLFPFVVSALLLPWWSVWVVNGEFTLAPRNAALVSPKQLPGIPGNLSRHLQG